MVCLYECSYTHAPTHHLIPYARITEPHGDTYIKICGWVHTANLYLSLHAAVSCTWYLKQLYTILVHAAVSENNGYRFLRPSPCDQCPTHYITLLLHCVFCLRAVLLTPSNVWNVIHHVLNGLSWIHNPKQPSLITCYSSAVLFSSAGYESTKVVVEFEGCFSV